MLKGASDWMDRAEAVDDPDVEVGFLTRPSFFVGDPNDGDQIRDPRFEIALPTSGVGDAVTQMLNSRTAVGREEELAAHYRAVVDQAAAIGRPFNHYRHHFWMRLGISWGSDCLSFPWYDSWSEMENLLGWLLRAEDGEDWHDADQGWELVAVRAGSRFYFRLVDPDDGEEYCVVSIDSEALLEKVHALRGRVLPIIDALSALLGTDVWTSYRYDDVIFGTADWRPGERKQAKAGLWWRFWER
jgi:hypothetical protein